MEDETRREPGTILVIKCECGYVIRGDFKVELLSNARNHIDEAHPEAESLTDDELLAEAVEQPA